MAATHSSGQGSVVGAASPSRMTGGRTLLFAVAGGATVGNLYWAQPLLEVITASLGVPASLAGLLVTVTQVGYAVGIFLLVPLGSTAVGAQLLIPPASELADDSTRGRVVGTIASGALIGILLSRTTSGIVADAFGWRPIYVIASVVTLVLAAVLNRVIPLCRRGPGWTSAQSGQVLALIVWAAHRYTLAGVRRT